MLLGLIFSAAYLTETVEPRSVHAGYPPGRSWPPTTGRRDSGRPPTPSADGRRVSGRPLPGAPLTRSAPPGREAQGGDVA